MTPRRNPSPAVPARIAATAAAFALTLGALTPSGPARTARAEEEEGPSLTVYSSADPAGFDPQRFVSQERLGGNPHWIWQVPGYGVVRESRKVPVTAGDATVRFTDVAEFIDPTSVQVTDATDPAALVLEQLFQFDLVSPAKLLERYVDREITFVEPESKDGTRLRTTGRVLSVNQGQVVLQTADGLRFVAASDPGLRLPQLPEGLVTKPALVWKLRTEKPGEHLLRTSYQTAGLTWRADYNVTLSADEKKAEIAAWVTLLNVSGASWRNTRLKLVAGDVQRIAPQLSERQMVRGGGAMYADKSEAGFEEKSFFEYHLYTLPRRTDVLQNQTQQITLFPAASEVGVEKLLVYAGSDVAAGWNFGGPATERDLRPDGNTQCDVYVRFLNAASNRMGMPLPKGKVRVFQKDAADGSLEFVGEDVIGHTPRDEQVLVKLGQAFDVVGERKQVAFQADSGRKTITETISVELRNRKDVPQKVLVREILYRWTNAEITQTTDEPKRVDAKTLHFDVDVPARSTKTVTYTVRYTW